ncbi:ABC transporter permease [Clostridium pasteurianum]|uniref:ABC transporter permease n=1 Tax=Clostridium pasteurianum TaxID=1501 RepID=UPI0022608EBD|nr:ABC transporter permease [Clostridium pasteurianum]UZW15937.1 ABC transporter permease [Clostridium pasteurianum]
MFRAIKNLFESTREIFEYKELLSNLTIKELKLKYRNSILGFFWSFLNPILLMLVYTFAFTYIIPQNTPHYTVSLLAALLPWNFFSAAVQGSTSSIVSNSNLIKKVYFPREIIPLSIILSNFVNFIITLTILFVAMAVENIKIGWVALLYPVVLILLLWLAIGLSYLLSALNVLYRDISHFVEIFFMLWLYLTPVIYPLERVQSIAQMDPSKAQIIKICFLINPMTLVVESCRKLLLENKLPSAWYFIGLILINIVLILVGNSIFRRIEKVFAEEI